MGTRARRRGRWLLLSVIAVVAVIVMVISAVFIVGKMRRDDQEKQALQAYPARPAAAAADLPYAAVSDSAPVPTSAGVSAKIAKSLRNPALSKLTGIVTDASTGKVLWSSSPERPKVPASTTKLLTAAAALLSLPADKRITTEVVDGGDGQIILKGAGDPTLSAAAPGKQTFFTNPGRIADLAAQIKKSGVDVQSIGVDTSAFGGMTFAKGWDEADIAGGNIAPIQPVMIDSARLDPTQLDPPRTPTPALDAGKALARALGVPTRSVREGVTASGGKVVASVKSAPLTTRLGDMIRDSDNILGETVAMEVAKAAGVTRPSISDGYRAVESALRAKGFSLDGVVLRDTSGLSNDNRIPASLLDAILTKAAAGNGSQLRPLLDMMPVAGASGTLAERFSADSRTAAGWVRAKTGTLSEANNLAGIVQDVDGRVLTFALMTNGRDPNATRPALDAIATALRECGCR